jgi:hypothetical protein
VKLYCHFLVGLAGATEKGEAGRVVVVVVGGGEACARVCAWLRVKRRDSERGRAFLKGSFVIAG